MIRFGMAMALVLAIAGGWPAGAGEPAQPDGEEARKTEALIKQLADPAAEERQKAAEALGKLGLKAKPAVSALIVAIGDEEKDVRSAAFDALIAIGPRAASDLIKALRDPDENRRKNAQAVLFNYNGNIPHVVSELIAMLDDKSPWVRKICAELLGSVGYRAQDARPKLAAMLDDPECMPSAAWALQQVGAPEDAAPRLLQLLKHEDPSVRVSASGALSMMAHRRMGIAKMTACVDDFVRLTEDQKWQTRGNAALALGDIGPVNDKVIPALVKRLDDEVGRVQVQALTSLVVIGEPAAPALRGAREKALPLLKGYVEHNAKFKDRDSDYSKMEKALKDLEGDPAPKPEDAPRPPAKGPSPDKAPAKPAEPPKLPAETF